MMANTKPGAAPSSSSSSSSPSLGGFLLPCSSYPRFLMSLLPPSDSSQATPRLLHPSYVLFGMHHPKVTAEPLCCVSPQRCHTGVGTTIPAMLRPAFWHTAGLERGFRPFLCPPNPWAVADMAMSRSYAGAVHWTQCTGHSGKHGSGHDRARKSEQKGAAVAS